MNKENIKSIIKKLNGFFGWFYKVSRWRVGKNDVKECYVIRRILKSVIKIIDRLLELVVEICFLIKRSSEYGG